MAEMNELAACAHLSTRLCYTGDGTEVEFCLDCGTNRLTGGSRPTPTPADRTFTLGQLVSKKSGSSWTGKVVGFYATDQTPVGYCVESIREPGSVQIYPEKALEAYTPADQGDLVERVARAICACQVKYAGPDDNRTLEQRVDEEWQDWEPDARAAIATLAGHAAELAARDEVIIGLAEALFFYADPGTYHACSFFFDRPTGGFDEDFSDDHGDPGYARPMPGKIARTALANAKEQANVR